MARMSDAEIYDDLTNYQSPADFLAEFDSTAESLDTYVARYVAEMRDEYVSAGGDWLVGEEETAVDAIVAYCAPHVSAHEEAADVAAYLAPRP